MLPGLVLQKISDPWSKRRDLRKIAAILPRIPQMEGAPHPALWQVQRVAWPKWSRKGVTVALVGPEGKEPRVALKLPHTEMGVKSLQRQRRILQELGSDSRLADIRPFLPRVLAQGVVKGQFYSVEEALPGISAESLMFDMERRPGLQGAAAEIASRLHMSTVSSVIVDPTHIERWVNAPARIIRRVARRLPEPTFYAAAVRSLEEELHDALMGRRIATSWIHGDFWPGNLLVNRSGEITGIIDWERAMADEPPLHDLIHLLLFTRKQVHKWGEADVIAALSGGVRWTREEQVLIERSLATLPGMAIEERAVVLLYWLRHTAATVGLLPEYARNRDYLANNVEAVLRCM
jgi:aminoglycoside phosphotransferase (APT) family kinase protein